jgi:hypothetical protein
VHGARRRGEVRPAHDLREPRAGQGGARPPPPVGAMTRSASSTIRASRPSENCDWRGGEGDTPAPVCPPSEISAPRGA